MSRRDGEDERGGLTSSRDLSTSIYHMSFVVDATRSAHRTADHELHLGLRTGEQKATEDARNG